MKALFFLPGSFRKALIGSRVALHGEPSRAQLDAGNYRKRRLDFGGFPVTVETPAGHERRGVQADGSEWSVRMKFDYGYIRGTVGADGDHVDCFLGPYPDAQVAYVVESAVYGRWREYDEDKVMLGFASEPEARRAFLVSYSDPRFLLRVVPMSVEILRDRLVSRKGRRLCENP